MKKSFVTSTRYLAFVLSFLLIITPPAKSTLFLEKNTRRSNKMPSEIKITSKTVSIRDTNLCVHSWPAAEQPRALAIIYHGFLAHGLYPTVRYAGDLLSKAGYAVVSADLRGHGQSEGRPGHLNEPDELLQDAVAIAEYAQTELYPAVNKVFFVGSSMGGTIALNVAAKLESKKQGAVAGVVLLAPMLRLSVDSFSRMLLGGLSKIIATWKIIPSSSTNAEKQYRDATKRKECEDDEHSISGDKITVGSARTCVELAARMDETFYQSSVNFPVFVLVADEDVVVKNQGSLDLMEHAASSDKTIQHYPALHGLLCEPPPLVDEIQKDLLDWIQARC